MNVTCFHCGHILVVPDAALRVGNPTLRCSRCRASFKARPDAAKKKPADAGPTTEYKRMQEDRYRNIEPGWLIVHDEHTAAQTFPLRAGKQLVGRKSASKPCDIMIDTADMYMSRHHFYIEVRERQKGLFEYIMYNDAPLNPTFLRQKDVKTDRSYLQDGDVIQAGATKIIFRTTTKARSDKDAAEQVKGGKYPPTVQWKR